MNAASKALTEAVEILRVALAPATADIPAADRARAEAALGAAQDTIREQLESMVRKRTSNAEYWDEVVRVVTYRLEDNAINGTLEPLTNAGAYLGKAVYWRILDLARQDKASHRRDIELAIRAAAAAQAEADAKEREAAWLLVQPVYDTVRRSADERYRASIERAWASLRLIHQDGYSLRAALLKLDPEADDPADPDALVRAEAALQKAHQRLRKALLAETSERVKAGRMPSDEGEDIERLVTTLRRRSPNRPQTDVAPA